MKEAWCPAVSDRQAKGAEVVNLYAGRRGIETSFRDLKDDKFGMGGVPAGVRGYLSAENEGMVKAFPQTEHLRRWHIKKADLADGRTSRG